MPRQISPGHLLHVARGRYAARVLTAGSPKPLLENAHRRRRGAPGCDRLCRARLCNGAPSPTLAGRSPETTAATDRPSTMPRAIHAAIHQARANARGAFILGYSELTLPAMRCVPVKLLCRDAGAMLPFGEDRTQWRPWLVVNPGEATAAPRASWLQPSGPTNFPGAARLPRETNFSFLPVLHCVAAAARCNPPVPRPSDHQIGRAHV